MPGKLKPVPTDNKGLGKLPTEVVNKIWLYEAWWKS